MYKYIVIGIWFVLTLFLLGSCASQGGAANAADLPVEREVPVKVYHEVAGLALGEPLAVTVDIEGNMYIGDGIPGRIVCWRAGGSGSLEFQKPNQQPGFYPADIELSGFFIYAIDPVERTLLRFDNRGAYRDILVKFEDVVSGRRITPVGLDVDDSGRILVADSENHQVLLLDLYLSVELAFGSYGTHPGKFDSPKGVTFVGNGDMLVVDTGNRRIQIFDAGGTYLKTIPSEKSNPMISPRRADIDKIGNVYVADPEAGRVFVFDEDGALIRSIVPDGVTDFRPTDIDVDRTGLIYVTDEANSSLFVFR